MRTGRSLSVPVLVLAALAGGTENLFLNGEVDGPRGWSDTGAGAPVTFAVDRKVGARERGSLSITNADPTDRTPHNWHQAVALDAATPSTSTGSSS